MRVTEFWQRMDEYFGAVPGRTFAHDHVIGALGNRTVLEALAAGMPPKQVWRAVCAEVNAPARFR